MNRILIIALAVLLVVGIVVGAILLFGGDDEPETPGGTVTIPGITPDYPAPPEDEGAEDVEDDEGKLWIATEYGISRFDPEKCTFENFFFSSSTLGTVTFTYCRKNLSAKKSSYPQNDLPNPPKCAILCS